MKSWKKNIVSPDASLEETIKCIELSGAQVAVVADEDLRILGVVTDGDIRRALLSGQNIKSLIKNVMNPNPKALMNDATNVEALAFMRRHSLHHLPLLDSSGVIKNIFLLDELIGLYKQTTPVVLMAGGEGMRLRPLTELCPKPMLKVGDKPILETVLMRFIEQGFEKFYISVNYLSEAIVNYFQGGEKWGVSIKYLHESKKLGTAGSLRLVKGKISEAFIMMNADIITDTNFIALIDSHNKSRSLMTIGTRQSTYEMPYGVIELGKNGEISSIVEKPKYTFIMNAGIYVIEPQVIELVEDKLVDMPELVEITAKNGKIYSYSIKERWIDVGRFEDLERVRREEQIN